MNNRLLETLRNTGRWSVLMAPGLLVIAGICVFTDIGAMLHAVGPILGIPLGIVFLLGVGVTNKIIWIISGENWIDDLMFK